MLASSSSSLVTSATKAKSKPVIKINLAKAMREAEDNIDESEESGVDDESDVEESEEDVRDDFLLEESVEDDENVKE